MGLGTNRVLHVKRISVLDGEKQGEYMLMCLFDGLSKLRCNRISTIGSDVAADDQMALLAPWRYDSDSD